MTKKEFLSELRGRLSDLPEQEIEERLLFYSEMIDDRMEDGITEEDAVREIGNVDESMTKDIPAVKHENSPPKKKVKAWEIVLLVLGSPIWLSLLVAVFAVVLSLYVSLWSVIVSLWAVWGSAIGCAFCGIAAGIALTFCSKTLTGLAMIGAGVACTGLAILLFYGCKAAAKGTIRLGKIFASGIKKCFVKEAA